MTNTHIGAGNVEIELDGEKMVLRPTLKAAQAISRQAGGIMGAISAIGKFDIDVMSNVVALGLGLEGKDARAIPEKVYATGMMELSGPVTQFLSNLSNGGRPLSGGEGDEDPQNR